jgi:hypothetical protein
MYKNRTQNRQNIQHPGEHLEDRAKDLVFADWFLGVWYTYNHSTVSVDTYHETTIIVTDFSNNTVPPSVPLPKCP